jgi:hypothetical protein
MGGVGFMLLTHDRPAQTLRLVDRLTQSFQQPPIVCHHDFDKCPLDVKAFPAHVRFVRPHISTGWGTFGTVSAILAMMRTLLDHPSEPEWFALLSGADYPIKSAEQIRLELETAPYDVYIHVEKIDGRTFSRPWHRNCTKRYFGGSFRIPIVSRKLHPDWHLVTIRSRLMPFLDAPFSVSFSCYAGEVWFTANRRTVERVLTFHDTQPRLAWKYAHRRNVDESYIQCIVGNDPTLRVADDCRRYTVWEGTSAHPKILTVDDLPALLKSNAHFARKFNAEVDRVVLDRLDALVSAPP